MNLVVDIELPRPRRYALRGDGHRAVIPGDSIDPAWDLMVFFEFLFDAGRATRWPDWRIQTPYFVIPTE